jgi:hypothetical protein
MIEFRNSLDLSPVLQSVLQASAADQSIRLDCQDVAKNFTLSRRKPSLELGGVHHRLTLFGRVFPQIAKGLLDHALPILGQGVEVLEGIAYLLAPLRGEVLQSLDAIHRPLALSRRHSVDLLQAIEQLLPSFLRKPVEAWFGR